MPPPSLGCLGIAVPALLRAIDREMSIYLVDGYSQMAPLASMTLSYVRVVGSGKPSVPSLRLGTDGGRLQTTASKYVMILHLTSDASKQMRMPYHCNLDSCLSRAVTTMVPGEEGGLRVALITGPSSSTSSIAFPNCTDSIIIMDHDLQHRTSSTRC